MSKEIGSDSLGDLTAMTVSLLGAGAILAASATLFTIIKILGAAYLIWLGIQLWRAAPSLDTLTANRADANAGRMFWNCYIVTTFNPKGIVFFIAFVPQFIEQGTPLLPQFTILIATFVILGTANVVVWAVLASEMRARLQRQSTLRLANRIGASFLIGAGLLTVLARRST